MKGSWFGYMIICILYMLIQIIALISRLFKSPAYIGFWIIKSKHRSLLYTELSCFGSNYFKRVFLRSCSVIDRNTPRIPLGPLKRDCALQFLHPTERLHCLTSLEKDSKCEQKPFV